MLIAIASGKGGTGKTTLATSLALVAAEAGCAAAYLDCDVEEPNGHLFLRPAIDEDRPIEKLAPEVDPQACNHCGRCAAACRYGALASLPTKTMVFAELCHACGGCVLACPQQAIAERPRTIGRLRLGHADGVQFAEGTLNVGEAMSPPAIRAVKEARPAAELTLVDAPPGTSCPAIEAVRECERVLLVTEATPFGLHDLRLAVGMVRAMKIPFAVAVNRADAGDGRVRDYCDAERIPILAEIPDDRSVAEAYARGEVPARSVPAFRNRMVQLLTQLRGDWTQ